MPGMCDSVLVPVTKAMLAGGGMPAGMLTAWWELVEEREGSGQGQQASDTCCAVHRLLAVLAWIVSLLCAVQCSRTNLNCRIRHTYPGAALAVASVLLSAKWGHSAPSQRQMVRTGWE